MTRTEPTVGASRQESRAMLVTMIEHLALTARMERHQGVAAECVALTGATPDADGIAESATVDLIPQAAYVHVGVRVLATAATFDDLLGLIAERAERGLDASRFRIEVHDPSGRLPAGGLATAIAIADVIPDYPDLKNPVHRFIVTAGKDRLHFGEVVAKADGSYQRHDDKPWTTSSSLDSRFARSLVNLVPDAQSILDPCCGAGSIVLEAASLGKLAFGVDWKPAMVGMTRKNLDHFGYDAVVERADSRTHVQRADAVVTDVPYGAAIDSDEGEIREILAQCAQQAPDAVIVAPGDISSWLHDAGYGDVDVHTVMKRRGFTRWIHVTRTATAPTMSIVR